MTSTAVLRRSLLRTCFPMMSALLLSACGPSMGELEVEGGFFEDEPGTLGSEIVGGTIANGDPAVVGIAQGNSAFCTGTLIGPRTVLTARHCVNAGPGFSVLFGTRLSAPTGRVPVERWFPHPSRDIAVGRLSAGVTNVTPIPLIADTLRSADIGRNVRHVGFGITSGGGSGFGTKRQVTTPLRQLFSTELESGAQGQQTCNGDSGGPALMVRSGSSEERLVGVVSNGDAACLRLGFDARVDIDRNFIQDTMAQWGDSPAAPAPAAPAGDNTAPVVSVVTPGPNATLAQNSVISISATAQDEAQLARVLLNWPFSRASFPCDNSSPRDVSCTRSGNTLTWRFRVGTGSRTFSVTAIDASGNETTTRSQTVRLR